jgi:lipid II:glycine glycyltransferase (peptidoglycan interpeptide bridge formation enzyme)
MLQRSVEDAQVGGPRRAGYTRFKRSFGGQVKEYAGLVPAIHAVQYSLYRAAKNFSNTDI